MTEERTSFGAMLRGAREAKGMSLREMAAATKISPLVLDALERNDMSRLPGGLFSRAFVRSYAREVGLDPDGTVREFVEQFGEEPPGRPGEEGRSAGPAFSMADNGGGANSGLRWFGLLTTIGLIAAFFVAQRYLVPGSAPAKPTASAAAKTTPAAKPPQQPTPQLPTASNPPAVPEPAAAPPAETGTQPEPAATPKATPAPTPTPTQPVQPDVSPVQPAVVQASADATERAPVENANLPLHLVLAPTAPCWISAEVDGKRIAGRIVQPGERVDLAAADRIVLTAGDAGALSYTVNNAPGRTLGAAGQSVTVVVTPRNYETFVKQRP